MLQVAESIKNTITGERIFALKGDLGSGKTTFVKAFAETLGLKDTVSSPTFALVNEYGAGDKRLFHFDLYRVETDTELYEIGFEEYLEQGAYVMIEWPDVAADFLPDNYTTITFTVTGENSREIFCRRAKMH